MEGKKTLQQRNLTQKQLDVLKLLYRFRFGTSDLIAQAQGGVSRQSTNTRLTALVDKELIIKKQDGRAKIEGKPAIYRLGTKGRAILSKEGHKYSPRVLNSIRANRDSSDKFVQRNLTIFSIFNKLSEKYKDNLVFLTKSNVDGDKFDYLPEVKPDAFAHLEGCEPYYFMYMLDEAIPDFAHIRRIASLFEYEKSGKWEVKTGEPLPAILLVCSSKRLETAIRKRIAYLKGQVDSELRFATTLTAHLLDSNDDMVWKRVGDGDEPLSLYDLT